MPNLKIPKTGIVKKSSIITCHPTTLYWLYACQWRPPFQVVMLYRYEAELAGAKQGGLGQA